MSNVNDHVCQSNLSSERLPVKSCQPAEERDWLKLLYKRVNDDKEIKIENVSFAHDYLS